MLAKIIDRAREIILSGEKLFTTPHILLFLKNKISINELKNDDCLTAFSSLDDNDIMTCVKVWSSSDDEVLKLSTMLVNRKLLKVKISDAPFSDKEISALKEKHQKALKIDSHEVNYFVFQEYMINNAYDPERIR